ncbi:polysialyltransferase family glycosyltransferase [Neobacillus niacini]|uniref:polysialyltransferase family glycosyltransferase n=1 Tax=Neobacillus niacini TaxID=86668 RepID=UPI002FFE2730
MHVFFVSTFGHLFHALRLIELKKYKNEDVVFFILTSDRQLAANIKLKLRELNFRKVEKQITWMPLYRMQPLISLRQKVLEIVEKYNPKTFNSCVFEIFYGVIGDIAREKNIKTVLYEEGLGSYKFLYNPSSSMVREMLNGLIVSGKFLFTNTFSNITQTTKAIKNLIVKTFKKNTKLLFVSTPKLFLKSLSLENQNKIRRLIYPKRYRSTTKPVLNYDEVYLTYPSKVKSIFHARKYKKLPLKYEITQIEKEEISKSNYKKINDKSVIFVNQRYISDYEKHFDFVLDYLTKDTNQNVFIKLHPRENNDSVRILKRLIKEKGLGNVSILDNKVLIPLEKVIQLKKPQKIVGFASSVLLYTKTISPKTEIISCVPEYINQFKSQSEFKKELDKIWTHYQILKETVGS